MLIAGEGEPGLDALCVSLERRGIEPIVIAGALEAAVRAERPNLVVLVGDAASDDGARGIDDARRAGQTPVVVATDPEPLDRRLAPFQYGASGVVLRRGDADEMAGDLQHLLAENARRIAERALDGRAPEELDGLVGLGSRDLRMSRTPHEGMSRRNLLAALADRGAIPSRPETASSSESTGGEVTRAAPVPPPPSEAPWRERGASEVPTVERRLTGEELRVATPLPDWDEDLTTRRQASAELARWRRLSAADRTLIPTPKMMAALGSDGAPVESTPAAEAAEGSVESGAGAPAEPAKVPTVGPPGAPLPAVLALGEETVEAAIDPRLQGAHDHATLLLEVPEVAAERARATTMDRDDDEWEPAPRSPAPEPPAAPSAPGPAIPPPPPPRALRPRNLSPLAPAPATEPVRAPAPQVLPRVASSPPSPPEPSPPPAEAAPASPPSGARSATGERISSSALLALSPPSRGPIEDRASTLRAQAVPRPRASAAPALIGLSVLLLAVGALFAASAAELGIFAAEVPEVASDPSSEPGARASDTAPTPSGRVDGESAAVLTPPVESAAVESAAVESAAVEPAEVAPAEVAPAEVELAAMQPAEVAPAEVESAQVAPMGNASAEDGARERSDALVREAQLASRAGDRELSRALLAQAIAADPDNPHALVALSRALLAAGDAAGAVRHAERAVALRRRRADYHVVLGDAHQARGDRELALESWHTALALEPGHEEARRRLRE